jgi:carboxypeptidase Q
MTNRIINVIAGSALAGLTVWTSLSVMAAAPQSARKSKKAKEAPASEAAVAVASPEIPDLEFISRLREEEFSHSEVMDIMSHLTDDIGARLTGSPNMKKANEWTRDQFTKWGLANAHLEPWGTFGRGWAYQLCEVRMVAPDYMQFLALPEAWTPGTGGPVRAEVVHVIASKAADLDQYKGKLSGKIVLLGDARVPPPIDKPEFQRDEDADLLKIANYEVPGAPV